MQTQERKSELLKYIKKELARFGEIQKKTTLGVGPTG